MAIAAFQTAGQSTKRINDNKKIRDMENISIRALSLYDFFLKKYAAGVITVKVSRDYASYVNTLKNTLNVKDVDELVSNTSYTWTQEADSDDVGTAFVFRITGNGCSAIITYINESGVSTTAEVKTGNAIVCIEKGSTIATSKWILIVDDTIVISVVDNGNTFEWGETITIGTVQGEPLTLSAPGDPADGAVGQVTFDGVNVLEDGTAINDSPKKKLRLPMLGIRPTNTSQQAGTDNRGLYITYYDALGIAHEMNVANIDEFRDMLGDPLIADDQVLTAEQIAKVLHNLGLDTAISALDANKLNASTYNSDKATIDQQISALQLAVNNLDKLAEGFVRVAGSSDPALSYSSYKYDETGGFGKQSAFSLFYPCLVGTPLTGSGTEGRILHVLQKLGYEDGNGKALDIYGIPHAIDGSEGDVMICNIDKYYRIRGRHNIGYTDLDVFLVSRTPFTWYGIEAEEVARGAVSPDFCVSHTDSDSVTRMHSVYNPAWAGSYSAPDGVVGKVIFAQDAQGTITETFDSSETLMGGSGGCHSTDITLYDGEQRAMNNNPDTTKTVPWMNQTAASVEDWFGLLLSESGTFDAHKAQLMGSGFCANDSANAETYWAESNSEARNGMRLMDKNNAWKYYSLGSNVQTIFGKSSAFYPGQMVNAWRNPFKVMEAHRAVSYAVSHGFAELQWFVYGGNKYKYRSVPGMAGPLQGEMTCVVWKHSVGELPSTAVDPTDGTTSIAGHRIEFLHSVALFHGITTQVSPSWWMSGLLMTEDDAGNYECYMQRNQAALVKSLSADNYDPATPRDFESLYKHVVSIVKGEGYAKNYSNDALMLPDSNANKSGGALHTYVGKYNWFTGTNANTGKRSVRGWRRGLSAYYASLSPLSMFGYNSPANAGSYIGFGTCCQIVD